MPSKKVKKRNTWNLRKILITLVVSLASVGLGSLMNSKRLETQSLYDQIIKLTVDLTKQKAQTNTAKEEAKNARLDNTAAVLKTCISFVQTPSTAPSEKL